VSCNLSSSPESRIFEAKSLFSAVNYFTQLFKRIKMQQANEFVDKRQSATGPKQSRANNAVKNLWQGWRRQKNATEKGQRAEEKIDL